MDLLVPPSSRPRRVLLYGVGGIGKSTWASSLPKPLAIQTEDGLGDIDSRKYSGLGLFRSYDEVWQKLIALSQVGDTGHKSLFIDSFDGLEHLAMKKVAAQHQKDSVADIGYGKGYEAVVTLMQNMLDLLERININQNLLVCLISHAEIKQFQDPSSEAYDRYQPRLDKRVGPRVVEWCDEVFFVNYEKFTQSTEEGFNKKRVRATGNGRRLMYTTETPCHIAKNRLGMPDHVDFSWQAYLNSIRGSKQ